MSAGWQYTQRLSNKIRARIQNIFFACDAALDALDFRNTQFKSLEPPVRKHPNLDLRVVGTAR